jgi:hypothetical protein
VFAAWAELGFDFAVDRADQGCLAVEGGEIEVGRVGEGVILLFLLCGCKQTFIHLVIKIVRIILVSFKFESLAGRLD